MGAGLASEFVIGARAQRFLDDHDVEREVTRLFMEARELAGPVEAISVFDERGLNSDETWAGKELVARKVVGEIRERVK